MTQIIFKSQEEFEKVLLERDSLRNKLTTLENAINILLDKGEFYTSAIELPHDLSGYDVAELLTAAMGE